ncbi:MAG: WbqC family protein [Chitinophagaceae bacterium]|nr:WbqC family protein [Chitinophagaceae bacterium]
MKTVVLQSNYLPWKGYFDLIHDADIFIYYDEVQYTKNDWRNRNRIYTKNGLQWLSIPIGNDAVKLKISEVKLPAGQWQQQHYKSLLLGYGKAPFFHQLKPLLEEVYINRQWSHLSELNCFLIETISSLLEIKTVFKHSADYILEGNRAERLVDLLKQAGATTYISGPSAKEYLAGKESLFIENKIQLMYKDYSGYPPYKQLGSPFENYVSIVDLLANIRLDEIKNYIWAWRK